MVRKSLWFGLKYLFVPGNGRKETPGSLHFELQSPALSFIEPSTTRTSHADLLLRFFYKFTPMGSLCSVLYDHFLQNTILIFKCCFRINYHFKNSTHHVDRLLLFLKAKNNVSDQKKYHQQLADFTYFHLSTVCGDLTVHEVPLPLCTS